MTCQGLVKRDAYMAHLSGPAVGQALARHHLLDKQPELVLSLKAVFSPKSQVEALTLNGTVFGDGAFKVVSNFI